ncbi:MAG: HAD family hydrolase [Chloroflexota bacterium]
MLKGVLFDLDDTLIDWSGFNSEWGALERKHLSGVFDYICAEIQPLDDFEAYCAEFGNRLLGAWTAARTTMRAPNLGTLLVETSVAFGIPPEKLDAHRCLDAFKWQAIPNTKVFPEVPETLALLRQHGIKIGIVTNAHQPMWIRDIEIQQHGIYDFFPDCRIAASDVGYLKPHPLIFQTALRCIGTTPEETVFVGDDLQADIVGAKAAGMLAIWRQIARRPAFDPALDGAVAPDETITSLAELPGILDARFPGWRSADQRGAAHGA